MVRGRGNLLEAVVSFPPARCDSCQSNQHLRVSNKDGPGYSDTNNPYRFAHVEFLWIAPFPGRGSPREIGFLS